MHGDVGPGTICTAGARAARQRRWRGPGSLLVVLLVVPDLLLTDKFSAVAYTIYHQLHVFVYCYKPSTGLYNYEYCVFSMQWLYGC